VSCQSLAVVTGIWTAFGQSGKNFEGFKLGDSNVQLDDTLLLIEPEAAKQYETAHVPPPSTRDPGGGSPPSESGGLTTSPNDTPALIQPSTTDVTMKARTFIGTAEISAATAKMRLVQIAEEVIGVLASDPPNGN
jgi:hypothetical protein